MAQQFLHRANVVPGLEQVRGERVAQAVARRTLDEPGRLHRVPENTLHLGLVQMMTPPLTRTRILIHPIGRKHPLPPPLFVSTWIFGVRQNDSAQGSLNVLLVLPSKLICWIFRRTRGDDRKNRHLRLDFAAIRVASSSTFFASLGRLAI